MKTGLGTDFCTSMFIEALFTTAKIWKQPKYLSTDEWIKKMYVCVYIYIYIHTHTHTHTHTYTYFSHENEKTTQIM